MNQGYIVIRKEVDTKKLIKILNYLKLSFFSYTILYYEGKENKKEVVSFLEKLKEESIVLIEEDLLEKSNIQKDILISNFSSKKLNLIPFKDISSFPIFSIEETRSRSEDFDINIYSQFLMFSTLIKEKKNDVWSN